MKKLLLLLVLAGMMPLQTMAQDDDLYFVPDKSDKVVKSVVTDDAPAYYRGNNRNVDEYNRAGKFRSYYLKIGVDSIGSDIISLERGYGVSPDSVYIDTTYIMTNRNYYDDDDYSYSRYMSRWDGFYDPWFYRYGPRGYRGWYGGWYDPWYAGYGGWYAPWYYDWYGGWYGGWYDPWYYGYGGWYSPYYFGWYGRYGWPYYGGGYVSYSGGNPRGATGYRTWTRDGRNTVSSGGRFGGYAGSGSTTRTNTYTSGSNRNRSFGGRTTGTRTAPTYNNSNFGNNTRSTPSFGNSSRSTGSFGGGSSSGGSFGGGRSGGSAGGGGGHFGGGRR